MRLSKVDLHTHTRFSDGIGSPKENIATAEKLGLRAIAITDHLRYPDPWHFEKYVQEVQKASQESKTRVLLGAEVDVLDPQGSLSAPQAMLEKLDFAIMAVHQPVFGGKTGWLEAVLNAMSNPKIRVYAHPFAFIRYYGYEINTQDKQRIAEVAQKTNTAIELNQEFSTPDQELFEIALKQGCVFSIGSDAHSPSNIGVALNEDREIVEQKLWLKT